MDSNIQIQTLKSQIENLKLQIDNIEMQNNQKNTTILSNYENQIGEQLLNLSIQMFNAGFKPLILVKAILCHYLVIFQIK